MKKNQWIILAAFGAFALVAGATIRAARVQVTTPTRVDPITATPTDTTTTNTTDPTPPAPVFVPSRPQVVSPYR